MYNQGINAPLMYMQRGQLLSLTSQMRGCTGRLTTGFFSSPKTSPPAAFVYMCTQYTYMSMSIMTDTVPWPQKHSGQIHTISSILQNKIHML